MSSDIMKMRGLIERCIGKASNPRASQVNKAPHRRIGDPAVLNRIDIEPMRKARQMCLGDMHDMVIDEEARGKGKGKGRPWSAGTRSHR